MGEVDLLCSICDDPAFTIKNLPIDYDLDTLFADLEITGTVIMCEICKHKAKNGFILETDLIGQ